MAWTRKIQVGDVAICIKKQETHTPNNTITFPEPFDEVPTVIASIEGDGPQQVDFWCYSTESFQFNATSPKNVSYIAVGLMKPTTPPPSKLRVLLDKLFKQEIR